MLYSEHHIGMFRVSKTSKNCAIKYYQRIVLEWGRQAARRPAENSTAHVQKNLGQDQRLNGRVRRYLCREKQRS